MPWTPEEENANFQITDELGHVIDVSKGTLKVGVVYEFIIYTTTAPSAVQMRALTKEQYESNKPRKQSHLLSVSAVVTASSVKSTFTPTGQMVGSIRLGFVEDPVTLDEDVQISDVWGAGGISVNVEA